MAGRVAQPGGLHQFLQRTQRLVVKVVDAVGLGRHHERLLAMRVLRGHIRGALAGVRW